MDITRKSIISRSEFNEIDKKLTELINLIDNFDYLYRDVDDLLCLSHSLFLLKHNKISDLKIVD